MKDKVFKIHSKRKEDNKFLKRTNAGVIIDLLSIDFGCKFKVTEIKQTKK